MKEIEINPITRLEGHGAISIFLNDLGEVDLSFSPNIIGGSNISYQLTENFEVSLFSKYIGDQYIDNTSSDERKLDAYFINNVLLNYKFHTNTIKDVRISLVINNIFNELYETNAWVYRYYYNGDYYSMDGYFPQAEINFLLGLSLKI